MCIKIKKQLLEISGVSKNSSLWYGISEIQTERFKYIRSQRIECESVRMSGKWQWKSQQEDATEGESLKSPIS